MSPDTIITYVEKALIVADMEKYAEKYVDYFF